MSCVWFQKRGYAGDSRTALGHLDYVVAKMSTLNQTVFGDFGAQHSVFEKSNYIIG